MGWVTINGNHVFIDDKTGFITKGPSSMIGMSTRSSSLINVQGTISLMSAKQELKKQVKQNKKDLAEMNRKKKQEEAFNKEVEKYGSVEAAKQAKTELRMQNMEERDQNQRTKIDSEISRGFRNISGYEVPLQYVSNPNGKGGTSILTAEGKKYFAKLVRENPGKANNSATITSALKDIYEKYGISREYFTDASNAILKGSSVKQAIVNTLNMQKKFGVR